MDRVPEKCGAIDWRELEEKRIDTGKQKERAKSGQMKKVKKESMRREIK